jgi:molecular chaperone Hsp33
MKKKFVTPPSTTSPYSARHSQQRHLSFRGVLAAATIMFHQFTLVRGFSCYLYRFRQSSSVVERSYRFRDNISSRLLSELNAEQSGKEGQQQQQSGTEALEEYVNESNRRDQVFSAMSADGSVKVTACTARNLLNDMMIMHTMTPVPADALGRTVICALLMSNGMQAEQTCQITINSDGPLRGIVAISDGKGKVRGYVGSPMLGDFKLQEAVGQGLVQVVKNHPSWPNPYNGITSIRYSDIDRDVGGYLAESEQRSCALAAATSISGILCTAAGGYLIEQLPDASPETLSRVEQNLATLVEKDGGDSLPTNLLLNGVTPLNIAEIILDGLGMQPLQQIEPKFECKCSSQRLVRALRLLPREEVDEILETQEKIEARCEFCGKTYDMGPEEIRAELDNATGNPSLDSDFKEAQE